MFSELELEIYYCYYSVPKLDNLNSLIHFSKLNVSFLIIKFKVKGFVAGWLLNATITIFDS